MRKCEDRITHINGKYMPEYTNNGINEYNLFGWGADINDENILIYEYILRLDVSLSEEKYELTFILSRQELEELFYIIQSNLTKFVLFEYDVKCLLSNICDLNIAYDNFKFEYHTHYNSPFVDITHKNEKTTNISIHKLKYLYELLLKIKGT